jgi:CubicO group peptidase (beta-lactamase class C family)
MWCQMTKTATALLLFSCVLAGAAPAWIDSGAEQIDGLFAAIKSGNEPGAAVLVLKNGDAAFQRGYGVADLKTLRKIDAQTNFRLASVTKQFTAMATMLLVHDAGLRYDARLTDIFPDFPEYGRGIEIRHLLQHTSGLLDYESLMPKPAAKIAADLIPQIQDIEVLELLKRQKTTKFAPGSRWEYSNSGYVLLGIIVERISGMPFDEFLRRRIFSPLKMDRTIAYRKNINSVPDRAFGHSRQAGVWRQTDQSSTSATLGDGGVYSSLTDLARWDRALREHTLLSAAEMAVAVTPVRVPGGSAVAPDGSPAEYGFGWFLNSYRGRARMWHYGETIGFRAAIQRFPDEKLTIIILCNRSDMNPTALALRIADLSMRSDK